MISCENLSSAVPLLVNTKVNFPGSGCKVVADGTAAAEETVARAAARMVVVVNFIFVELELSRRGSE